MFFVVKCSDVIATVASFEYFVSASRQVSRRHLVHVKFTRAKIESTGS